MNVLLLHPQFEIYFTHEAPIGLAYLQAVLRGKHNVKILDNNVMNYPIERIVQEAKKADAVGISVTTPTFATVRAIAKAIKQETDIPIIVGGAHATIDPKGCLEFADYAVCGEAEYTFPKLIDALESKNKKALGKIAGLAYIDKKGKFVRKENALIENLDELPFPDWSGFPLEKYGSVLRTSGRSLPIVTSRGCPYNCIYCFKGLFGRRFRARSPENVIAELEYLKEKFHIREFQVADDAFATNPNRAIEICRKIAEGGLSMPWSLPNGIRVGSITDELAYWMKRSGLQYAGLGIESGNQRILNRIDKQQTLEQVRRGVALLKKHKITTVGFFMFGLPEDTEETMRDTVEFAKSLDLDYYSISMTTPYPGTRLYDELLAGKGSLLTKTPEELFSLGSKAKYMMPGMASAQRTEELYKKARLELLLRPKTILRTLKHPKRLIAGAKVAYQWIVKT